MFPITLFTSTAPAIDDFRPSIPSFGSGNDPLVSVSIADAEDGVVEIVVEIDGVLTTGMLDLMPETVDETRLELSLTFETVGAFTFGTNETKLILSSLLLDGQVPIRLR